MRLTAIFDSCHSGSALDLPYIYSTQGVLKEPNLAKEAGQGLLSIVSSYRRGDLGSVASTALGFFKKATSGDEIYQRNLRTKTSPADDIMWSGSKDDQTSYVDQYFHDRASLMHLRRGSVMPVPPEMYMTSPEGQVMELKECFDTLDAAFMPFRDMHGMVLI